MRPDVDQIVHHARHEVDLTDDQLAHVHYGSVGQVLLPQDFRCIAQRGQRIAQLVPEHGEELVLCAIGDEQLFARAYATRAPGACAP